MLSELRGIIRDMAILKDLYDFVKYVDEVDDTDNVLQFSASPNDVYKQYAKAKSISEKDAKRIVRMANYKQLVTYTPLNEHTGPPNKVITDSAGVELIEKTVGGRLPSGLILAWMNKHHLVTNLLWIIIGVILGNIGTIVNFIQNHL